MDVATVVGLLLALGAMVVAFLMEGGDIAGLINPSAALIVFGGTFGATFTSFPMGQMLRLPGAIAKTVRKPRQENRNLVRLFVDLARKARREGLLSLEDEAEKLSDPFLKKGLLLVVDGTEPAAIRDILGAEMASAFGEYEAEYEMLEAMGGFAPTMGIIGTVMGLVVVLSNLSDPSGLGHSIAVAFVATLYGVASANILWLPLGSKLKKRAHEEDYIRQVMLEGILAIMAGDNPRIVKEKLDAYLSKGEEQTDEDEQEIGDTAGAESVAPSPVSV